jgi:hypothetical protein
MVMTFSRVCGALAAFVLSTVLFNASAARANIVFDFSGDCTSGCAGTATGVLTLSDSYTFGADITMADFISLTYSSSGRDFELQPFTPPEPDYRYIFGGLNANGSFNAAGRLLILTPIVFPYFQANAEGFMAGTGITRVDKGSTFSFRREITTTSPGGGAVPEPSTWAMMLLGLASLSFAGYRKRQRAAARV